MVGYQSVKKILVLRYRSIGDIILSYPTIEALKNTFPYARIDMLIDDTFEELCHGHPYINFLILNERKPKGVGSIRNFVRELKFIKKIRWNNYDMVIDLHSGPRSALLTLLSGAKYRVGHMMRLRSKLCYNIMPLPGNSNSHSVDVMLKTIAPLNPIMPKRKTLFLKYSEGDRRYVKDFLRKYDISEKDTVVMIHPGARVDFKRLPANKMGAIVRWLTSELGVKVIYAGSDSDLPAIAEIVSHSGKPGLMATNLPLGQLAALIDSCNLFVGNDSGPMHMAAAMGVPLVVFFGPTDPAVWAPWGTRGKIVRCKKMECMPCDQKHCPHIQNNCMARISVTSAKKAILSTLKQKTTADRY